MLRGACLTINSRPTLKSIPKSTPTFTLKSIQSSTPTDTYLAAAHAKTLLYKPTRRLGSKNVPCLVFIAFSSDFSLTKLIYSKDHYILLLVTSQLLHQIKRTQARNKAID